MRPDVARPSTSSSQGWELCSEEILSPGDMYTAARDNLNNYLPLRTSVVGFSLHPLMTLLQLSSSPQLLALAWQYVMFLHARSPRQIKITEPLPLHMQGNGTAVAISSIYISTFHLRWCWSLWQVCRPVSAITATVSTHHVTAGRGRQTHEYLLYRWHRQGGLVITFVK